MSEPALLVGTVGEGIWRSLDFGETFSRITNGMFVESDIRALARQREKAWTVYAGGSTGLYKSEDRGDRWTRLAGPFDPNEGWSGGTIIWSLLVQPGEPDTIFVGACPATLWRSDDGGVTWTNCESDIHAECGGIQYARVTTLVADASDSHSIWAGVEIDGLQQSTDGGISWQRRGEGLSSQDIHGLVVQGDRLIASTNNDLNISEDGGLTWKPQNVSSIFDWGYCRGIAQKPDDPQTLYVGNGNGPPGSAGAIRISRDGGASWVTPVLPTPPNSTVWTLTTYPANPDLVVCSTVHGYIYLSTDAGRSWKKSPREFGEIRSLALL